MAFDALDDFEEGPQRLTGIVVDLHPRSNADWSRFKLERQDGSTVWATAKFGVQLREVVDADAAFNAKFKSYDIIKLHATEDGSVSNDVVILRLIDTLDGVGEVKARKLGEKFPNLFVAITETPQDVADACGVSLEKVVEVSAALKTQQEELGRTGILINMGYPNHIAKKAASDDKTYVVAKRSPYEAIRVVNGLGWAIADEVGRKLGIKRDDRHRIAAGIDHYYHEKVAGDGHTRVSQRELLRREALPALLGLQSHVIFPEIETVLIPISEDENGKIYTSGRHRRNAEAIRNFFVANLDSTGLSL